ncbi:hypothetical protein HBI79_005880 [Parastagonospora nodorum]|nr:hypothetical protein HBI79_005880 [Parastagonospora nodorum]KAH5337568.1 hypothetical protein HBI12_015660 [Parastagonospora nodorum]
MESSIVLIAIRIIVSLCASAADLKWALMSVSPSRTGFLDLNSGASENTARQGDGTWAICRSRYRCTVQYGVECTARMARKRRR